MKNELKEDLLHHKSTFLYILPRFGIQLKNMIQKNGNIWKNGNLPFIGLPMNTVKWWTCTEECVCCHEVAEIMNKSCKPNCISDNPAYASVGISGFFMLPGIITSSTMEQQQLKVKNIKETEMLPNNSLC